MKKVVAILSLVLFAGAMQTTFAVTSSSVAIELQDELVKITTDELPDAVKQTLASADYQGWAVEEAYHNKTKDHYELKVKKEAETKTLKFSKDGKEIK
ncbi:MAG: hypothetical protein J0L67_19305 [Cytophagales bacterium]|jgi:hypothetical protein|nr:hypothetical protein [Cytophagales bacterium]